MSVSAAQVLPFDARKTPTHPEVAQLLSRLYSTVGSYSAARDWALISDAYDLADAAQKVVKAAKAK